MGRWKADTPDDEWRERRDMKHDDSTIECYFLSSMDMIVIEYDGDRMIMW